MRFLTFAVIAGLAGDAYAQGIGVAARQLQPNRQWSGLHPNANLKALVPANKVLDNAGDFAKVYKSWINNNVPNVDFRKHIILVFTTNGPNKIQVQDVVLEGTNVKANAFSTLIGGPGFGFRLVEIPRDGVRSFRGKAIGNPPAAGGGGGVIGNAIRLINPVKSWTGSSRDESLAHIAPANGVISSQQQFINVYSRWVNPRVPAINFNKYLVLAFTTRGPNRVNAQLMLEGTDLKARVSSTLIGGPGFGFLLAQIPRDGIRTVRGKAIAGAKPRPVGPYVRVEVRGTVQRNFNGRTEIVAGNIRYELDLSGKATFPFAARKLNNSIAVAEGYLSLKGGFGQPQRRIVKVDSLRPAK